MANKLCDSALDAPVPVDPAAEPRHGFVRIYDDVRRLAGRRIGRARATATLPPTALAHEVYLRLSGRDDVDELDPDSLLRVAARTLRSVLVDQARRKRAERRSPPGQRVAIADAVATCEESVLDLQALDEALDRLQEVAPDLAAIVELRFFGGHSMERIAAELGISLRTTHRGWNLARRWLYDTLREE